MPSHHPHLAGPLPRCSARFAVARRRVPTHRAADRDWLSPESLPRRSSTQVCLPPQVPRSPRGGEDRHSSRSQSPCDYGTSQPRRERLYQRLPQNSSPVARDGPIRIVTLQMVTAIKCRPSSRGLVGPTGLQGVPPCGTCLEGGHGRPTPSGIRLKGRPTLTVMWFHPWAFVAFLTGERVAPQSRICH